MSAIVNNSYINNRMTHFLNGSPTIEGSAILVLHFNTPGLPKYKPYPNVSIYPVKRIKKGYIGQKKFNNFFNLIYTNSISININTDIK